MIKLESKSYVGVDVSKNSLDVYIQPSGKMLKVSNDEKGLKKLKAFLPKQIMLVVFEATGGYERYAAQSLSEAELPVAIVNPRQVRDFAKALGQLSKTDKIDSRIIALFAEKMEPPAKPPVDAKQQGLSDLRARRKQLVEMIVMEKNRLHTASKSIKKSIAKTIKFLEKELEALDKELQSSIAEDPE
jgi:transposase